MMNTCRMCPNLIITQAITFADGTLTVNIPAGSYGAGCNYCLLLAQAIPAETTINAPVVVTIGDGTVSYPLTKCNCAPVTACALRTRTKYPVIVATSGAGGSFRVLGKLACAPDNSLTALDGTDPTEGGGGNG